MNEVLGDEIISISSIYDEATLVRTAAFSDIFTFRLPCLPAVALRLRFSLDYPSTPPLLLGIETVGNEGAKKGDGLKVLNVVRETLKRVYRPGEPCIFDLIEEAGQALQSQHDEQDKADRNGHEPGQPKDEDVSDPFEAEAGIVAAPTNTAANEPSWALSNPITEKKSVFIARAATVHSTLEAKAFLNNLLGADKKVAKATHNVTAWRIRGANGTAVQDCDDDGESAAGSRVLHLMQIMDVWDVIVIVTRWYGGKHLGPDRFRIINNVAREALTAWSGGGSH